MKNLFNIALLSLCVYAIPAQAGEVCKNWEPIDGEFRVGKKTTTIYRPENTPLQGEKNIRGSVYFWQDYAWRGEDLTLVKTDTGWVSTVSVPKNAALVVYKYAAGNKSDNGGKNMYAYFTTDKKGQRIPSSYTGWALLRNKNTQGYAVPHLMKDSTDMWIDDEVLRFWLNQEVANNPQERKNIFTYATEMMSRNGADQRPRCPGKTPRDISLSLSHGCREDASRQSLDAGIGYGNPETFPCRYIGP